MERERGVTGTTGVTPDELADVMTSAGKPITAAVIRYHCRDSRGMLYGLAERVGRSWRIPAHAADAFADLWNPYGSLRRRT
jgi:hypothetical protein